MADERADECIREHEQLASRRGVWEGHWREVAERVRPNQNTFQGNNRTEGAKRNEKIFDDTAPLALPKFAAAVISMCMPPTQRYHKIVTHDPDLMKNSGLRKELDITTDILFRGRYAPQANFQSQSGETVLDVGAFGTGILFTDDVLGIGVRYKSFPLAETFIAEDAHGNVDTLHRKFELSAHQAATMFGTKALPEAIQKALEKDKTQKFNFLHCVRPNMEKLTGRKDFHAMAFNSLYIATDARMILSEGGYRRFPFATPRFETSPREVYGRSPAMKVLPTIKTLNEAAKTILRAAQKVVAPPIMLTEDASLQAFSVRPDALNYGYVDNNGRAQAIPFHTDARVDIGMDMMNQWREAINDAFFVTLFRILVEEPQITATEAMLRAQEKGQLLAPTMGRIQSEMMGSIVERELDIYAHAGALPPKVTALILSGGSLKVEYQSPLNQAQRASEGVAIMNTFQAIAPLAQVDPSVMMIFDMEAAARELADINGVPESIMRSDEDIAALKAKSAQAQQMQQLLAAAPVAASAAKDFAQASSMAGSSPNQQAPSIIPQQQGA